MEFYKQLPPGDELENIQKGVQPPATLLELGCGAGRLTRPLLQAGYLVTAVDNSPEMLRHVECEDVVLSDIESLELGELFDVVLIASRLLNCPDHDIRNAMIATAKRHLPPDGVLIAEVHSADILRHESGESSVGQHYAASIASSEVSGSMTRMTIEYRMLDQRWRHSFETEYLSAERLRMLLAAHKLDELEWLDSACTWLKASAV